MPASTPARSSLALRRIHLLQGLEEACLQRLAAECDWRSIGARRPICMRNAVGTEVFFLVSGSARITSYSLQGREVSFRDYEAGAHFGELAALDNTPRMADVMALTPSVVACLPHQAFRALLEREPAIALRVIGELTLMVRGLAQRVIDLSTLGVQTRLHAELLRLARQAGVQDNQARLDPAPAHALLASLISTSREQVTREMGQLARSGLLRKDGAHALVVTDVQCLDALVAAMRGA